MPGRELLRDVVVVLVAAFPVLYLFRRLRLPQIVGFLVTGVAIGPHALGFLGDAHRVGEVAELGVVLILLFVGLQFPIDKILELGRTAVLGGALQMGLTIAAAAAGSFLFGSAPGVALFHGFLVAVSSTAVLLPILSARDELASPYGRCFLGVALFQDLAVIPLVLLVPALAPGGSGPALASVLYRVGIAVVATVLLVAGARRLLPRLLDAVARLGSRETFTGGVFVVVLAMIGLAELAGVSAAMGAFAAGIVLGESDHVHEVAATLAPLRDLLSSLFFVSIGMLLDPGFLVRHAALVGSTTFLVLALKLAGAFGALRLGGVVPRTALRAAIALATIGEFSFVLVRAAGPYRLLDADGVQVFVSAAVITLALAPFLVSAGPRIAAGLPERVEGVVADDLHGGGALKRHVVVVGAGLSGRNVARVMAETGIPYVLVDVDPERVALVRREGLRAIRADATAADGLRAAGIESALGAVLSIPDPDGIRRSVRLCRLLAPDARLIVRTRYVAQVEALRALGADEVIPEEFETSIEIVARVLNLFHLPGNIVSTQIRLLRDETYRRLRDPFTRVTDGRRLSALVAAGTTELFLVLPDTAAEGRTLGQLNLELEHVAVPALLRDGQPFAPPSMDLVVQPGDTLLLVGAHEDLARVTARLEREGPKG